MLAEKYEPRWRARVQQIDSGVDAIRWPNVEGDEVSQDEEWCDVVVDGESRRVRFHDYHRIYQVPGLYEQIFYERLECCSPSRVSRLLSEMLTESGVSTQQLRVLDVGAGNGMVGDELDARGADTLVGVDIIPEAKQAAERDRPGLYDDYRVVDLTRLSREDERQLRAARSNCLTCVAALGFGDIPPAAFARALDLVETPAWVAFTIKEDFIYEQDDSGFSKLIRSLCQDRLLQIQAYRRYQHRVSITGKPLYYVAMVARKLGDVPAEALEMCRE